NTVSGVAATRRSPGADSLGTAILIRQLRIGRHKPDPAGWHRLHITPSVLARTLPYHSLAHEVSGRILTNGWPAAPGMDSRRAGVGSILAALTAGRNAHRLAVLRHRAAGDGHAGFLGQPLGDGVVAQRVGRVFR